MEVSTKRRGSSVVAAGSVWESRMKSDEVRGGIKVFNAEEQEQQNHPEEEEVQRVGNGGTSSRLRKRSSIGSATVASSGKRKTWKSETHKNSEDQQCNKELSSSSSDGIKKSPIHTRKIEKRSPIHSTRKLRSDTQQKGGESGEGNERNSGQLRKTKSDSTCRKKNGSDSVQLRKTKSDLDRVPDEPTNDGIGGCEKIEDEKEEKENHDDDDADVDEDCKDFDVCQEKEISSSSENVVGEVQSSAELSVQVGDDDLDDAVDEEGYGEEEEVVDEEIEIEMENEESFDVKEISIPESKVVVEEPESNKVVVNEQDKKVDVNEPAEKVVISEPEPKKIVMNEAEPKKVVVNEPEPKKVVSAHMRFHHKNERRVPVSVPLSVKQSSTIRRNSSTIYQNFSEAKSIPKADEYHSFPQTQSKLQSLGVDLIMWRDVSRSAFVFGIGTFIIVSSSYAKDINLSVISAVSYVGLVYLAVIFLYRSLICRGIIDVEDSNYVLGEEDAIWMLKLILPYLNEFLSKLKALFSGDPGTTMKLAVLLFVLARCGSFITIWKMAKFGFFGVFTVPKICSTYSAQLTAYGNFWIRRFRDAWDSCTHKKAVALGIFGLVWNLSSVVARVWAVFVLFVAFRYYQQHYLARDEWVEDEAAGCDDETWQEPIGVGVRQKQGRANNFVGTNKVKKGF